MDRSKILIIDDIPLNIKALMSALGGDYHFIVATDGATALKLATMMVPDLILLDIIMPGMDGYEVCQKLKKTDKTQHIPIIFITSKNTPVDETRGLALGAADFIGKPFHAGIVQQRVAHQLELKQHRDNLEEMVVKRTAQLATAKSAAEEAREVAVENERKTRRLLEAQEVVRALLDASIRTKDLDKFMERALSLLFTVSWLSIQKRGAIFLADEPDHPYRMVSATGEQGKILKRCKKLPEEGSNNAEEKVDSKTEEGADGEEESNTRYPQMMDEGDYVVPILADDEALGAICLYLVEGYERSEEEDQFLQTYSRTISGIIRRVQAEQSLREKELQLIHADRLTALGEMSTGIAHEINQPLTIIRMRAESLNNAASRGRMEPEKVAHTAQKMMEQVDRTTTIINHMRSFSRSERRLSPRATDLAVPTGEAFFFFREQFRKHDIELVEDIPADLPLVNIHDNHFEQIVINLLSNARYAVLKRREMEPNHTMRVRVALYPEFSSQTVILDVEDNGLGMTQEEQNRCLEPFFSTKEVGQGTGLGLYIVIGIINEYNGKIQVESEFGAWTRFQVALPILSENNQVDSQKKQ
ncbi:MAG: response regulator [Magnetococcales bacterium]|nr:response regulator [Magnetococcales bacterium]